MDKYPDMKSMFITIYVHHMDIDPMYDYINGRIKRPPNYWINPKDLPESISGGFLEVNVTYEIYTLIREVKEHSTFSNL
jgi:hypothetical protein